MPPRCENDSGRALEAAIYAASETTGSTVCFDGWIEGYASTLADRVMASAHWETIVETIRTEERGRIAIAILGLECPNSSGSNSASCEGLVSAYRVAAGEASS